MAEPDLNLGQLYRWADQLPAALWEDLRAREPQEATAATGAQYDAGVYRLTLLARQYLIDPDRAAIVEAGRPEHRVSYDSGVVLVTTLAKSQGVPPSGELATPSELPGGRLFYTGPHELPVKPLLKRFGRSLADLIARGQALGGRQVEAGADLAMLIPGLPQVPLWVLLWAGDEEFQPRAVIGIDQRAHYHLAVDAILAICNVLVRRLTKD